MKRNNLLLILMALFLVCSCSSGEEKIKLGALDHFKRGNTYMEKLQYKAALSEYKMSLNYDPEQSVIYYNMGLAYYSLMLFDQAVQAYQTAIGLNPDFNEAWYNLSLALYKTGKTDEAFAANEKYIQLSGVSQKKN